MVLDIMAEKAVEKLAQELVVKLVIPKITGFTNRCKGKYNEQLIPKAEHFQEYLLRSYKKYSIINTLVFHNSQRLLKDIYVAQTLIRKHDFDGNGEPTRIDQLPIDLIKKYKKILITDTAGMGKSTIMKRMFIDVIDNSIKDVGIPVYIELNRLNKSHNILQEIQEKLNSLSKDFNKNLYLDLIQTGGFVFFLDGYDEITLADRGVVTQDLQSFISRSGENNFFIMTSRPEDNLLTSFGDFQSFSIKPLSKKDAFELLNKYDLSEEKLLSIKLIKLLKSGKYGPVNEYLVNPLLVSLLFTAYDFNRSIPLEKHHFYRVVFEAYFEKHDNTKPLKNRDKYSGLNYDGFDSILRRVGFNCLVNSAVQFNEDWILNAIREARSFCGNLDFSESEFLKDLILTVPLFCREGTTDYKWVHKSLLEYFAARFIFCDAKEKQDFILTSIYKSSFIDNYINMLDIYYDLDYKGFSKNITLPLCETYIKFHDELLKEFDDVVKRIPSRIKTKNRINKKNDKNLIEERVGLLFMVRMGYYRDRRNRPYLDDRIKDGIADEVFNAYPNKDKIHVIDNRLYRNMVYWIAIKFEVVFPLVKLMLIKKPDLFLDLNTFSYLSTDFYRAIESCIKEDNEKKAGEVTISHNLFNSVDYATINKVLRRYVSPFRSILSYNNCEKEAQLIREGISKSRESNLYDIK